MHIFNLTSLFLHSICSKIALYGKIYITYEYLSISSITIIMSIDSEAMKSKQKRGLWVESEFPGLLVFSQWIF